MPTIPTWLIAILAIAAVVCMVVSYIKKDNPKFKPLAVVAVIILIVCSYAFIDNSIGIGRENLETRTQQESAKRFNEAKIKKVAEYIKSKNPGKIVIIPQGGSEWAKNEYAKEQAELVKKYVGDAEIKPVEYTRKPEEAPAEPPKKPDDVALLEEIRDLLKAQNGEAVAKAEEVLAASEE